MSHCISFGQSILVNLTPFGLDISEGKKLGSFHLFFHSRDPSTSTSSTSPNSLWPLHNCTPGGWVAHLDQAWRADGKNIFDDEYMAYIRNEKFLLFCMLTNLWCIFPQIMIGIEYLSNISQISETKIQKGLKLEQHQMAVNIFYEPLIWRFWEFMRRQFAHKVNSIFPVYWYFLVPARSTNAATRPLASLILGSNIKENICQT